MEERILWSSFLDEDETYEDKEFDLDCLREILNKDLPHMYMAVMENQLWNGISIGAHPFNTKNLREFLAGFKEQCEYEIYVDENSELKMREFHHDGTNIITFRELKKDVDDPYDEDTWLWKTFGTYNKTHDSVWKALNKYTIPLGSVVLECLGVD